MQGSKAKKNTKLQGLMGPAFMVLLLVLVIADAAVSRHYLANIRESLTIEAGQPLPKASEFLEDSSAPASYAKGSAAANTEQPGTYSLTIETVLGKQKEVRLIVTEPELTDKEAPVISGAQDITVMEGENVIYLKDVSAADNEDPDPQLSVDNSSVDLNRPGSYTATYIAEDSAGNTSSKAVTVTVTQRPADYERLGELYELADGILSEIISEDMSDIEKAFNIYAWVKKHVHWRASSEEPGYISAAINAFAGSRSGNCITFNSALKVLLERAGFTTITVERYNGPTTHYWLMINLRGSWYHCDATPRFRDDWVAFLKTDAQLAEYTEDNPYFYQMKEGVYPATPKTQDLAYATYEVNHYVLHLVEK